MIHTDTDITLDCDTHYRDMISNIRPSERPSSAESQNVGLSSSIGSSLRDLIDSPRAWQESMKSARVDSFRTVAAMIAFEPSDGLRRAHSVATIAGTKSGS